MMRKQPSPRCSFLQQINEVSFAVNDMLLYLDTHPEDQKALRYFSDISDRRNQLMAEYAEKYGPLTIDIAAVSSENAWKWSQRDSLCGIMKKDYSIQSISKRQMRSWLSSL